MKWYYRIWTVFGLLFILIGVVMLVRGQGRDALIWFGATAVWVASLGLRTRAYRARRR